MKKIFFIITVLFLINGQGVYSQLSNDTLVYLVTCGPGTETYSIYGHSAIRIVIPAKKSDMVFNWGVFDFDTPHFAWKFAKGRLDYKLGVESLKGFLEVYVYEKRYVQSQRINLNTEETTKLITLIRENLRPENIKYRYDFFYDDCSTKIRDLMEKSIGDKLLYPPQTKEKFPTFREMTGKYQDPFPWLKFGIDLIMGSPGDKRASYRDRMFLPIDLQRELSETVINRDGKMVPLLQNPEVVVNFAPPKIPQKFLLSPAVIFTLLLTVILIVTAVVKSRRLINMIDILIFVIFSVLSVLMIFFNFFTDHQQMQWNLNILWLNPFIPVCLLMLFLNKKGFMWFRILFYISAGFLLLHFALPQKFNIAFIPLNLILIIRSSVRAGFEWNPQSLD